MTWGTHAATSIEPEHQPRLALPLYPRLSAGPTWPPTPEDPLVHGTKLTVNPFSITCFCWVFRGETNSHKRLGQIHCSRVGHAQPKKNRCEEHTVLPVTVLPRSLLERHGTARDP